MAQEIATVKHIFSVNDSYKVESLAFGIMDGNSIRRSATYEVTDIVDRFRAIVHKK